MMQQFCWDGALELSRAERNRPDLYDQWLSFLARQTWAYGVEQKIPEKTNFQVRVQSRSLHGFTLMRIATVTDSYRMLRDAARIARDGGNRYGLCMSLRGGFEVSQFGRNQRIESGSYTVVSASEPGSFSNSVGGQDDSICFFLPGEFVDQRIVSGEEICARPYAQGRGLHKLVFETLKAFEESAWGLTDDEFQKSANVIADLSLLAVSGSADLLSAECSVRVSTRARAKRVIRQRLGDDDLSLSDVAQESGVSLSYLHDLFRDEDCTAWEYLKTARLQRARELLYLASSNKMSITDIALSCGFSNMSYFSKAFRSAFGVSPKDALRKH
jgi:AraC-like DNA-binding protein